MSCGIDDEIECAFRAEVEDDSHYKSIVDYLRTGKYTCQGPMNEDG